MILRIIYASVFIFLSSLHLEGRPYSYNLDSIIKYSDFCDKVEIIYYHSSQLSVKSRLDSLTYTFFVNEFFHEKFSKPNTEYILIRGRVSYDLNSNSCIIIGELIKDEYVFYLRDKNFCCYYSTNPIAKTDKSKEGIERIKYPKSYFKFNTPSLNRTEEEKEGLQLLFLSGQVTEIKLNKFHNQFLNDSIHIRFDTINQRHLKLTMHLRASNAYEHFPDEKYMQSILNAAGLPYKEIVEGSDNATYDTHYNHSIYSYSNKVFKLVTYILFDFEEERVVMLEIHK